MSIHCSNMSSSIKAIISKMLEENKIKKWEIFNCKSLIKHYYIELAKEQDHSNNTNYIVTYKEFNKSTGKLFEKKYSITVI